MTWPNGERELCHEMELHQKHLPRLRRSCVLSRASPNVLEVADLSATSTVAQEEEYLQLYKKALLHMILELQRSKFLKECLNGRHSTEEAPALTDIMQDESLHLRS